MLPRPPPLSTSHTLTPTYLQHTEEPRTAGAERSPVNMFHSGVLWPLCASETFRAQKAATILYAGREAKLWHLTPCFMFVFRVLLHGSCVWNLILWQNLDTCIPFSTSWHVSGMQYGYTTSTMLALSSDQQHQTFLLCLKLIRYSSTV